MERRLPSLNALRAFEAAARHRSLTRAARELNVTPAAVSHQVKALEADLGLKLLRRQGQDFVLTPAAAAALPRLRDGFDRLVEAVRLIREDPTSQLLNISVGPSFASIWLIPRLDRFKALHPDIDVRLETTDVLANFARDDVDLAIRFGQGNYSGLTSTKLLGEDISPMSSPGLLESAGEIREPADLLGLPLLHVDWQSEPAEPPSWIMWFRAAGLPDADVGRGLRFSHASMAFQAALSGQGVALLNADMAAEAVDAGYLVSLFDIRLRFQFAYHVVCPEGTASLPKIAAFRNWLLDEAQRSRRKRR